MEQTGILVTDQAIMDMTRRVGAGSSSILKLLPIGTEYVPLFLALCLPALERAVIKTDEIDVEALANLCREGEAQLVIEYLDDVPQGCAVTMVIRYPLFSACEVLAIGAFPEKKTRWPNKDSLELLQVWARLLGCKRVQGYCDEAVARLWRRAGFKELSRKIGMDI